MSFFRALLFNGGFYLWTAVLGVLALPVLLCMTIELLPVPRGRRKEALE